MTQYTDSSMLNGKSYTSNYFYTASNVSSGAGSSNGAIYYTGQVTPGMQSTIEGTITSSGNGYFTITSSTGVATAYQVLGSTADGKNLIFEASQSQGSNTGPYYILSSTPSSPGSTTLSYDSRNGYTAPTATAACFVTGTRIATRTGYRVVEDLRPGDLCMTANGVERPVRWVGQTRVHARLWADPASVNPIVISCGALADGVPTRDLWVSPGHRMLIDGKLYPAGLLQNGSSIVQRAVSVVEYHHVELDLPDALLAEGAAAESYLDVGNRATFDEVVGHPAAAAMLDPDPKTETFAPVVTSGPDLAAVRSHLLGRAVQAGWVRMESADIRLSVAGQVLEPVARVGSRQWFVLNEPATSVAILSKAEVYGNINPDSADRRLLGVQVAGIVADGRRLQLGDPSLEGGFYDHEVDEDDLDFRWTNGRGEVRFRKTVSVLEIKLGRGAQTLERADECELAAQQMSIRGQ